MKTNKILLTALLTAVPLFGFAQEWDDIYADPTQNEPVRVQKEQQKPQKKKVVIVQGDASDIEVTVNGRDVDEYNRRNNDTLREEQAYADDAEDYEEYEYTDRIVRFHDPESSIKITGADEVIVYVGDDLYENYNNRGWDTNIYFGMGWGYPYYPWYYRWYDPWYYGSWYSPWYYGGWYDPWFYGYGSWYGWGSPWYYSGWYSPWYYGGWYDPWFYGYSGYHYGFYDGYYSSLSHNRSGRSSGIYRTSSANTASSAVRLSGRSSSTSGTRSAVAGRSATSTRSGLSGRSSSVNTRSSSATPRTRIIDNSGRAYDSRTGQVIDRTGSANRSGSVNRATLSDRYGSYNSNTRSATRSYQRSTTAPTRSSSTYQRSTTPSRSSSTYSTPSRSSSSTRSSTYSAPSRSSSSAGSFGGSSSRSSGGSSSGRSSSGRR